MNAYAYNPLKFYKQSGTDWQRWLALYKFINFAVCFIDRTGFIKTPIRSSTPDSLKLPEYDSNFNLSYQDCCRLRVTELIKHQDALNVPIRLMYSGGIDSSLILASFIEQLGVAESSKRIELLLEQESIHENPWMWQKFIRPHFNIIDSDKYGANWSPDNIIVGGEGNDQLMGSDIYRDIVKWGGDGILYQPWTEESIRKYFQYKGLTPEEENLWYELLSEHVWRAPCPVETIADFWWWINFSCKWATVYYRMMFYAQNTNNINESYLNNYYQQFFNTPEFQKWSMIDREHKHQGNFITYKFHARELIATIINAPEYLNKIKKGSLSHITKFKPACDLIDQNYQFHYDINPNDWYNPDNNFNF
jgi:hypothetical protein